MDVLFYLGTGPQDSTYSVQWETLAWRIPQKFLPSRFTFTICSPLNTRSSAAGPALHRFFNLFSQLEESFTNIKSVWIKNSRDKIDLVCSLRCHVYFKRCLFYNGGLGGKCFLGHRWFSHCYMVDTRRNWKQGWEAFLYTWSENCQQTDQKQFSTVFLCTGPLLLCHCIVVKM